MFKDMGMWKRFGIVPSTAKKGLDLSNKILIVKGATVYDANAAYYARYFIHITSLKMKNLLSLLPISRTSPSQSLLCCLLNIGGHQSFILIPTG